MKDFNNGENIMIPINESDNYEIIQNDIDLWEYSQEIVTKQRLTNQINKNCMMITVLNSLKLNSYNIDICKSFKEIENKIAIHFRIESDWVKYSKKKNMERKNNELYLIDYNNLIDIYVNKFKENVFFTT